MTTIEDANISDEMLVAYVDGELSDSDAGRVEAALAADAELARSMKLLALSGNLARDAYVLPETAADDPLADLIVRSGRTSSTGNVVPFSPKTNRRMSTWATGWALPIAASVVLLAATVVGTMVLDDSGDGGPQGAIAVGPVAPGSELANLLETKPSGTHASVAVPGSELSYEASVVASFEAPGQRFCRELELIREGTEASALTVALACRDGQGTWSVKGAVTLAATQTSTPDFQPASGADEHAVERLLATEGLSKALAPDAERELLRRAWR